MKLYKTSIRLTIGLFLLLGCSFIPSNSARSAPLSSAEQLELGGREALKIAKQTVDQKRANVAYLIMVADDSSEATPTVTLCEEFSLPSLNSTGKSEIGFQNEEARATLKGTCENKDGDRLISFDFSIKTPVEGLPAGTPEIFSERSTNTSIQIVPGEIVSFGRMSASSIDNDTGETTSGTSHFILYCP
jgi:hypothetical protein